MDTRSKTCRRSKAGPCSRLSLHKGACRPTLTRSGKQAAEATPAVVVATPAVVLDTTVTVEGRTWNIVVLADGTSTSTEVVASPEPNVAAETRKAGKRTAKARRPKVRTLKPVGPEGRDVQQQGHAKRAKAAPAGTRDVTIAESLRSNPVAIGA